MSVAHVFSTSDIINGLVTICPGRGKGTYTRDVGAQYTDHLPSGAIEAPSGSAFWNTLDGRFKVGATGSWEG